MRSTILFFLAGIFAAAVALGSPSASQSQPQPSRIHDCPDCPLMVVIPGGDFLIGSPDSEPGRHNNEGPQRRFHIKTLAVSETEITRKQFESYLRATRKHPASGCDTHGDGKDGNWDFVPDASWMNPGFPQRDNHPVVCVSWQDAHDYARWIAARTGQPYRLLTEAEWEHAARAGSTTAFYWGAEEDAACRYANGGDRSLLRDLPAWSAAISTAQREGEPGARLLECDDGAGFTSAVGRLRPNAFGLKDMSGNVWEWVEDCYVGGTYDRHTEEGGLPDLPSCERHRARGGSWDDYPIDLRSARRTAGLPLPARRNDTGFRIARDIANF
jgi:formylglycine-generating enzyme required for sulfatase activity